MQSDKRFEFDARENGFSTQFPSILMAATAITLIVIVNVRANVEPPPRPAMSTPSSEIAPARHVAATVNKVSSEAASAERAKNRPSGSAPLRI